MKTIFRILLVIICVSTFIRGQALNEAFLNSTVYINYPTTPNNYSFGSGFLIFKELQNNQGHVFLITNKHVIPKAQDKKTITLRLLVKDNDTTKVKNLEVSITSSDGKYLDKVKLHPNKDYDVVAINITDDIVSNNIQATWLPYDLLVTKDKLKNENITVGDEIFILGYPDAIFDERNTSPILRVGVISSVPTEGFAFNEKLKKAYNLPDEIDGFLIDANVFPGSSGSLVVLKQQPTTIGQGGATVVSAAKKIPYVLGIVSGSIPIIDSAIKSVQRMGLGIVYSTDTIKDTIELFYK